MLTIIIYDVADDRRRMKVQRILKDYGVRIQKSAFEARVTPRERGAMIRRLGMVLNSKEDLLGVYGITADQEAALFWHGKDRPAASVEKYFV